MRVGIVAGFESDASVAALEIFLLVVETLLKCLYGLTDTTTPIYASVV